MSPCCAAGHESWTEHRKPPKSANPAVVLWCNCRSWLRHCLCLAVLRSRRSSVLPPASSSTPPPPVAWAPLPAPAAAGRSRLHPVAAAPRGGSSRSRPRSAAVAAGRAERLLWVRPGLATCSQTLRSSGPKQNVPQSALSRGILFSHLVYFVLMADYGLLGQSGVLQCFGKDRRQSWAPDQARTLHLSCVCTAFVAKALSFLAVPK